jgi:hypothetical protein
MNFKTAINNNSSIKKNKKSIDISNWSQYGFKDGKIKCLNPFQELTEEKKQQEINKTLYQISHTIELNRRNYMMKYDELHGEGAYERLYYMKPIYDEVQLELELMENDENDEYEYENENDYEYNVE